MSWLKIDETHHPRLLFQVITKPSKLNLNIMFHFFLIHIFVSKNNL